MIVRHIPRLTFAAFTLLVIFSTTFALAANVSVPTMRLTDQSKAITADALKPSACSGLTLTRVVVCTGGNCDGSNANELMIGTPGSERIRGRGGTDCIIGGGGDDQLVGNGKSDVCIGGPGIDSFLTCENTYQ